MSVTEPKSGYSREELHSFYRTDSDQCKEWLNIGPLNVYSQAMGWMDAFIYPDYKALSKVASYVGSVLYTIEHEKLEISQEVKIKVVDVLIDLIPAVEELTFGIEDGKLQKYGVDVRGWKAEGEDSIGWLFREIVKYDRGSKGYKGYNDEIEEVRGRNKLIRIMLLNSPVMLRNFKTMRTEQIDAYLKLVRSGNLPHQLISDEEIDRLVKYNEWTKNEKQGEEPTFPAKARWTQLIVEQSTGEINFQEIGKKISEEYKNDQVIYDGVALYNMVDLDSDDVNNDIPSQEWDSPGGFRMG